MSGSFHRPPSKEGTATPSRQEVETQVAEDFRWADPAPTYSGPYEDLTPLYRLVRFGLTETHLRQACEGLLDAARCYRLGIYSNEELRHHHHWKRLRDTLSATKAADPSPAVAIVRSVWFAMCRETEIEELLPWSVSLVEPVQGRGVKRPA